MDAKGVDILSAFLVRVADSARAEALDPGSQRRILPRLILGFIDANGGLVERLRLAPSLFEQLHSAATRTFKAAGPDQESAAVVRSFLDARPGLLPFSG